MRLSEQAASAIENANIYNEIRQRLEEQRLIRMALNTIASSLNLDEILRTLCKYLCEMLDATSVYVSTFNSENQMSTGIAEFLSKRASDLEKESDLGKGYYEDDQNFLKFIDSGIPTIDLLDDPKLGKLEREHMSEYGVKTILYIPLRMKGKATGYIEIWESRSQREFSNAEISISEAIAKQAAISIENAMLYKQAQEEIAERSRAEQTAREAEAMIRSLAENSPDHILLLDTDLKISYVNYPSPGLTIEQLTGTPLYTLVEKDQQPRVREALESVLESDEPVSYETTYTAPDGETLYYESRASVRIFDGEVVGLVVSARDIGARKEMEKRLEFLATHDPLTNLSNRRVFETQLIKTMKLAERQNLRVDVAIIDLDNFKTINDTKGHLVGDLVLTEVARRLVDNIREGDIVARMGGDEFVILFVNPGDLDDISILIERLLSSLSKPIELEGDDVCVSGSMGISTYFGGDITPETMLKHADTAMYAAKDQKEQRYKFYQGGG